MESSTILTADVLDILFEGRNKEYGAYDLRKTYNRRLTVSISVMLSTICMLTIGYAFAGKKAKVDPVFNMTDINLATVAPPEEPLPPPPPPVKPPAPPVQVAMKQFTTVKVVQDDEVKPDEMPPANETLDNVKIGNMNQDGIQSDVVAPPIDGSTTGVIEAPKKEHADEDGIFMSVQIPSEYPGGSPAWMRFLNKNLRYPQEAQDQGVQGFVTVQFIVDKEGNVSDVEAVSGPEELRAEAVRVIKKSGKWTPAVQNGNKVKSYKKQPIGFQLNDE
jgi:protein TonB